MAHAYLISTNSIQNSLDVLLKVIKNIFCMQEYQENCKQCSLCHLIDINNLPSLKIIESEGNFIKKEQILELQEVFSKSSLYTKEKVYIIKNCEKMNKESANTILKFLEEPAENIIGFFITEHIGNVIPTIVSRCQKIELIYDEDVIKQLGIDKEKYENLLKIAKLYINEIEDSTNFKNKLIIINQNHFENFEKNDILVMFKILLNIYQNHLNSKILNNSNNPEEIESLKKLSIENITKKLNLIAKILNEMNYNINVNMLLDRFVIEMDGINESI